MTTVASSCYVLLDTYLLALDPPVLRGKNQEYHLWPPPVSSPQPLGQPCGGG
jgi:hypothetical protein